MNEMERLMKEIAQKERELRELKDEKSRLERKVMKALINGEEEEKEMKEIQLTEMEMQFLLKDIRRKRFHMDGCRCGTYAVQLRDDLGISFYRTCHKSGGISADKFWHIDDAEFYQHIEPDMQTYKGNTYLDGYIEEELFPYTLNKEQSKRLMNRLKRISLIETGMSEYRN